MPERARQRAHGLAPRIALAGGAAIVTLLAVELGIRVFDSLHPEPTLGDVIAKVEPLHEGAVGRWLHALRVDPNERIAYGLRPSFDATIEFGETPARLTTNSFGFRGREWPREKPKGTARIVGLGDSLMMGHGVAAEATYLAQLEAELDRGSPEVPFEVLNLAVGGYNPTQEVATLREVGVGFGPDLVLVNLVENDQNGIIYRTAPLDPWTPRRSLLLDALTKGTGANEVRYGGWGAARDAMRDLASLRRERGFEVLVFCVVSSPETKRLLQISSEEGLRSRDLGPALDQHMRELGIPNYYASEYVLGPHDAHPSAKHHHLIEQDLLKLLESEKLLDFCRDRVRGGAPPSK